MANYLGIKTLNSNHKPSPEQKLWMAVLGAAAEDALSTSFLDFKGYPRSKDIRIMDKEYFLNPGRSFYQVCRWAGFDPDYVKEKMEKKLCLEK